MWIAYNLVSLKAALLDAAARATACTVIAIVVRSLIGWDSLSHYMAEGAYEPADWFAFLCAKDNFHKVTKVDIWLPPTKEFSSFSILYFVALDLLL